ncbi:hypothetical protein EDD15DRAFT_302970 [Pisolithus albus]|nr:hypothetical protein EDD15DRAFT_302970 [Pisolithus albus]
MWLCWCGICAELDELLPKVVDYIRREGNMKQGLQKMCSIMRSTTYTDPGDDRAHLQRIMLDAGVQVSKHDSWLAARAAEQAKSPASRTPPNCSISLSWAANEGPLGAPLSTPTGVPPGIQTCKPSTSVITVAGTGKMGVSSSFHCLSPETGLR